MNQPTPSQCPVHHATSAVDSIEFGISVIDEIASMVNGIHALTELPLEGVTLAQLKKRMTSLNNLALLTVRFADGRSDILGEIRGQAQDILDNLNMSVSECWMPTESGTMPPAELTVVAWDGASGRPATAFFDQEDGYWCAQSDGARFDEGAITHWRHCNTPEGAHREGGAS